MTRKDYIRLADALASVRPRAGAQLRQFDKTVAAVADALAADNARFDRERFLNAVERDLDLGGTWQVPGRAA